jgi:hypothetical protein
VSDAPAALETRPNLSRAAASKWFGAWGFDHVTVE